MAGASSLSGRSDKLKSAVAYVSETMQADPTKDRNRVVEEAVMRFDLSPADSEFFYRYFSEQK